MAKKLSPTKLIIEKQKQTQKEEEKKDKIFKDKKVQEIEVPGSSTKKEMDRIDAWTEGTNTQIRIIIDQLNSLDTVCIENFKYIHKKIEDLEKQNGKLHYILDEICARLDIGKNDNKPIESKKINKKENNKEIPQKTFENKMEEYEQKIIEETGLSKEEIRKKVLDKKEELKGLISNEGALFIIAKEFGIELQNEELTEEIIIEIKDLTSKMFNLTVIGTISWKGDFKSGTKKDGGDWKLLPFEIEDSTGKIRVTAWGDAAVNMQEFNLEDIIILHNAMCKFSDYSNKYELNISNKTKIEMYNKNGK